jgi:hypothetical protein
MVFACQARRRSGFAHHTYGRVPPFNPLLKTFIFDRRKLPLACLRLLPENSVHTDHGLLLGHTARCPV